MGLANYTELKAAISDWMFRSDLAGNADEFIDLAEAHLNREIAVLEVDQTLTGTPASRVLDISSYSVVSPIALFILINGDERELTKMRDGDFAYDDTAGEPSIWAVDGNNARIDMNKPLDEAYTFRFRYRERFALSEEAPTNWLLTNHPDVYLASCIFWAAQFTQDAQQAQVWAQTMNAGLDEVKHIIAVSRNGQSGVDDALVGFSRYPRRFAGDFWA